MFKKKVIPKKLIIVFAFFFMLSCTFSFSVFAETKDISTVKYSSNPLYDFFDDLLKSDNSKLEVYSNIEKADVTEMWEDTFYSLFTQNRTNEIQDLIKKFGLQLSKTQVSSVTIDPKGSVQTETITRNFYFQGTANNTTLSWEVSLSGKITYSTVTNQILSATSPSLSLVSIEFDYPWSPYITNISTGYTIHSSSVYFWGKHTLMASYGYPMIGGIYNFGTNAMSFEGYPAF